jgi:hypothetical protein
LDIPTVSGAADSIGSPDSVAVHNEMPMKMAVLITVIRESKQIRLWLNMIGISYEDWSRLTASINEF